MLDRHNVLHQQTAMLERNINVRINGNGMYPSLRAVRIIRQAISPRLAINKREIGAFCPHAIRVSFLQKVRQSQSLALVTDTQPAMVATVLCCKDSSISC